MGKLGRSFVHGIAIFIVDYGDMLLSALLCHFATTKQFK